MGFLLYLIYLTRLVILAKLWLYLPDDGSNVNRNMLGNLEE